MCCKNKNSKKRIVKIIPRVAERSKTEILLPEENAIEEPEIELNSNITILDEQRIRHSKASEEYVSVLFSYENSSWEGWVPVEYRRTGVSIKEDETNKLNEYLNHVYEKMDPSMYDEWLAEQTDYWKNERQDATVTKGFFDVLLEGGWKCTSCTLPNNPNWSRRIQDLKEFGYTLATDTKRYCPRCQANKTHILLLPIPRGNANGNGYETWPKELRERIINVLGSIDVYENAYSRHCIPDHKFSEIRWDAKTKADNPISMTEVEIRNKFQLLSNQRNEQKREVCRNCFQTGSRGVIYGIPFFYEGSSTWDDNIPIKGKEAEAGCVGCPWYDIEEWRKQLIQRII